MLMAAGPASAENTELCKVDQIPCPAGSRITHLHMVSTFYKLLTSIATVECTSGLELAEVLPLGAPQVVHVSENKSSGCKTGSGTSCEVKAIQPGLWDILRIGTGLALYIWLKEEISLKCGAILNCTYGGEATFSGESASGSSNGTVTGSKVTLLKIAGAFCPEKSFLDSVYEPLEPTYISG
jgi:hypothetical protein